MKQNKLTSRVRELFSTAALETEEKKEVFRANEIHANITVSRLMNILMAITTMALLLDIVGVFKIALSHFLTFIVLEMISILPSYILCRRTHGKMRLLKQIMLTSLVFCCAIGDYELGHNAYMFMAIPLIVSSLYYDRKITLFVTLLTLVTFGASALLSYTHVLVDLNHVSLEPGTTLVIESDLRSAVIKSGISMQDYQHRTLVRTFLPQSLVFLGLSFVASEIAYRGRKMADRQADTVREQSRIETELNTARSIQEGALPSISDIRGGISFELAAGMTPAKEIGGDFYNFLRIDDDHLALVIADVSGKGVPAAMFMMVSKLLLDNALRTRRTPGEILTDVNHQLCERGTSNMFVTVWLGIIDLTDGTLICANGGHEDPLIRRAGGAFERYKSKHGLLLGMIDGIRYGDTTLKLEPGDTLFIYTDGVPEANNAGGELFGMERTLQTLNGAEGDMQSLLDAVHAGINEFEHGAPQFDDITMMALRLKYYLPVSGLTLQPVMANAAEMKDYLEAEMRGHGVAADDMRRMNIAIDEIWSNIIRYSGATWANGSCEVTNGKITITFRDDGLPFDPIGRPTPDLDIDIRDRQVGGLGLYMTRMLMSSLTYERADGVNINRMMLDPERKPVI